MSTKVIPKFRPYLTVQELAFLIELIETRINTGLVHSSVEDKLIAGAMRTLQKTYINARTGSNAAYNSPVKQTTEELLELTPDEVKHYSASNTVKTLTDDEKLELMLPSERAEYWIKFNKDNFGIEPTTIELDIVVQLKQQGQ